VSMSNNAILAVQRVGLGHLRGSRHQAYQISSGDLTALKSAVLED